MIFRGGFENRLYRFFYRGGIENRLYRAFMSIEAVLIKALLKFLEAF
jgi:hypothetical protein